MPKSEQGQTPPAKSNIQDLPAVAPKPVTAPTGPTIPEVKELYKLNLKDKFRCFWRQTLYGCPVYEAVDGSSYSYDKSYEKLFGGAYLQVPQLSSPDLHNGSPLAGVMAGIHNFIRQQTDVADSDD